MILTMDRQAQQHYAGEVASRDDLLARIGPRILDFRNQRGWNQIELARRAKLRAARLSRLERGLRLPKLDELVRLAEAFETGLDELAFGEPRDRAQSLRLLRDLEVLGTPEELAGLKRLLQLLVLGYQAASSGLEGRAGC